MIILSQVLKNVNMRATLKSDLSYVLSLSRSAGVTTIANWPKTIDAYLVLLDPDHKIYLTCLGLAFVPHQDETRGIVCQSRDSVASADGQLSTHMACCCSRPPICTRDYSQLGIRSDKSDTGGAKGEKCQWTLQISDVFRNETQLFFKPRTGG